MKIAVSGLLSLISLGGLAFLFGPREPIRGALSFAPDQIGADLDAYLRTVEADIPNITPGAQKQIVWHDPATKARTPVSIVYVHGYSATPQEIRPVPDNVAAELGANLYFTRLKGHGRDGDAMLDGSVPGWMDDMAEALEIGRRLGDRVVIMGTSTGATMAAMALQDDRMNADVVAAVQVSPNYKLQAGGSQILGWPFARQIVPLIVGDERGFEVLSDGHGTWWTTRYPSRALPALGAALRGANALDFSAMTVPSLFVFSEQDQVISATRAREVAEAWGAPAQIETVTLGEGDDPSSHVIAGDVLSPGMTESVTIIILDWLKPQLQQ